MPRSGGTLAYNNTNRMCKVRDVPPPLVPPLAGGEPTERLRVHCLSSPRAGYAHFLSPSPPAPFPLCGRGEPHANTFGVLKRPLQQPAEAPLPHSISPSPARQERETQGVRAKEHACLAATAHGKIAPASEILYLTAAPLSRVREWGILHAQEFCELWFGDRYTQNGAILPQKKHPNQRTGVGATNLRLMAPAGTARGTCTPHPT